MCTIIEAWEVYIDSKNFNEKNLKKEISRFNLHLLPYWQDKPLQNIKTIDIVFYKKHLFNKNLSKQSVRLCLSLLQAIMRRASTFELYSGKIPNFELPKIDNKRIRYLTEQEASLLFSALYTKNIMWHDIALFALHTGMRASEIFAIRTSSINLAQKSIAIFESKNSTTRIIPLNETALDIIQKYLPLKLTYFFSNNKIKEVSSIFRNTVCKTNLNKNIQDRRNQIVFHSLRHTFASWLVQRGVPILVVSQLLGHKSLQMTMRYAHLAPNQGQYAVDLLPNNISPLSLSRRI